MVSLEVNAGLQIQFFCLLDGRGVEPVKWRKLQTEVVFLSPYVSSFSFSPPCVSPDRVRRLAQVGIYGMWAPPLVSWAGILRCS